MSRAAVRVGVVGTGFGARVVAPAFDAVPGVEVVEVVSARDEAAVSALCRRSSVDLISVHSPPFLHHRHIDMAVSAGHGVLCDKPFGCNAGEAEAMVAMAASAGVVAAVNFEMRCDPLRRQLRQLVADGAIGAPSQCRIGQVMSLWRHPPRPHGWLFDQTLGGGWLRAMGSHDIDFARWVFGEVTSALGTLRTDIEQRFDADGMARPCTADDGFTAVLRTESGVGVTIDSSAAGPLPLAPSLLVIGDGGVLQVTADQRIVRHGADGAEVRLDSPEPLAGGPLAPSMQSYAAAVAAAVGAGGFADAGSGGASPDIPVASFADGLACVTVIDRLAAPWATTKGPGVVPVGPQAVH